MGKTGWVAFIELNLKGMVFGVTKTCPDEQDCVIPSIPRPRFFILYPDTDIFSSEPGYRKTNE